MLIRFSIENYKSFRDKVTLDCRAAGISELEGNVLNVNGQQLLKSISILGANASGKSNLFYALETLRDIILYSLSQPLDKEALPFIPFKLNNQTEKEPTFFEIEMIIDKKAFIYGIRGDKNSIKNEWLFRKLKTRNKLLFARESDSINLDKSWEISRPLLKFTNEKTPFLSVASRFNIELAESITEWFSDLNIVKGISLEDYMYESFQMLENKNGKDLFIKLLKAADIGIQNVKLRRIDASKDFLELLKEEYKEKYLESLEDEEYLEVKTIHHKYDNQGNKIEDVEFNLAVEESEGTRKFFGLIGMIINSLMRNEILIIDELDSRLHPYLVNNIIELFNSKVNNYSQLICINSHTNILRKNLLRRDQVYLIEKDHFEVSRLNSVVEFDTRKEQSMEKHYKEGKLGGLPLTQSFEEAY